MLLLERQIVFCLCIYLELKHLVELCILGDKLKNSSCKNGCYTLKACGTKSKSMFQQFCDNPNIVVKYKTNVYQKPRLQKRKMKVIH